MMFSTIFRIALLVAMMPAYAQFTHQHEVKTESFLPLASTTGPTYSTPLPFQTLTTVLPPKDEIGTFLYDCPETMFEMADSCRKSEHSCQPSTCMKSSQDSGGPKSCSCDASCHLFKDCCWNFNLCSTTVKPSSRFAFAGSQDTVMFHNLNLDLCDEENQMEISSVYFTSREPTMQTMLLLINGDREGANFILLNPGPIKERLCNIRSKWTFSQATTPFCRTMYVSNATDLCERTMNSLSTSPNTVNTTKFVTHERPPRRYYTEKRTTVRAQITISTNKTGDRSAMNQEIALNSQSDKFIGAPEEDDLKIQQDEVTETTQSSKATSLATKYSFSSYSQMKTKHGRLTSPRNHLLQVTQGNTTFWHVLHTEPLSQVLWNLMECVPPVQNPSSGKILHQWSCHLIECKTGLFFYQKQCLRPEIMTVSFDISNGIVLSKLEQLIHASRNIILNYWGMTVSAPLTRNRTRNIQQVDVYKIKHIKNVDYEKTIPISKILYNMLAPVYLGKQGYSESIEVCFQFQTYDTKWKPLPKRCDLLTADEIISNVEDYTLRAPGHLHLSKPLIRNDMEVQFQKSNISDSHNHSAPESPVTDFPLGTPSTETQTKEPPSPNSQDHRPLENSITDNPLFTSGAETENKTGQTPDPQAMTNVDRCQVPLCSDNEQIRFQENTTYQDMTLSNAGPILEMSVLLTQLSIPLFVLRIN